MSIFSNLSINRNRLAIAVIFFCYGLTFSSWASRIPTIQAKFDLSEAQLGTLLLMLPIGSFIALPLAGYFVAKFSSSLTTKISIVMYLLSLLSIAFMDKLYLLGINLFLFGMMSNMVNIAINTQAVNLEKIFKRNIMASFHGMWSLAGFFGALIGAIMIGAEVVIQYHYFIVFSASIILSLVVFRFLLTDEIKDTRKKPIFAWPDKSLMTLGLIAFFSMMCEGTMFDWSGIYYKKIVDAPEKMLGLAYTFFMISMAATRFIADFVTSKYGIKKVIFASGCFSFSGLMLLIILPGVYTSLLSFLIIGVGVSSVVPLAFSMAGKSRSMPPSVALAAVSTMGFFGFLIAPPLVGYIASVSSLKFSFGFVAAMAFLVIFLSSRLKGAD